ncbi:MAG: restriction endonuclease, partial [Betaproteobacteria bacterium]|nr:restriction endonuclease [Betaproteobacteria bacterium]
MIGQLFTQDFLLHGIRETPVWKALDEGAVAAFVAQLRAIFRSYSGDSVLNEAITEDEIILKVLGLLDWQDLCLRQATTSGARREDVPDLLLFPDANAKQAALKEKRDDRRYRQGIAILESKRWLRPLDRGEATDRLDPGTPSNQILRYLSSAEVASDRAVRWGMLTNGRHWRLYFQGARSRSEDFLELDLGALLGVKGARGDTLDAADAQHGLKLFLCLFHRAAFLAQSWDGEGRSFHQFALAEARQYEARVSENLGARVFGTVFPELADALWKGDSSAPKALTRAYMDEVREATLILLYRLLFVLYAEDRELLPVRDKRYAGYSLRRLREEVRDKRDKGFTFSASAARLWDELTALFQAIANGDTSLGLPAYNGGLFEDARTPLLARVRIPDAQLAPAIDELSRRADVSRAWINYRDLSVQHLGGIYERLLEYRLEETGGGLVARPTSFARKGSGSYYTHDDLVKLLIAESIGPLAAERAAAFDEQIAAWKGRKELKPMDWERLDALDPASRVLELKVCDPAMGSGHFLVALVDDLADRVLESMSHAAETIVTQRWAKDVSPAWESPVAKRIADIRKRIL